MALNDPTRFPTRQEMWRYYCAGTGRDIRDCQWFSILARFKSGCLLEYKVAQAEAGIDDLQVAGHRLALHLGQLQHTEYAQQQPNQGHSEQCAAADKQPAAQVHRLSCLRLRYRVEASMPRVFAA